MSARAVATAVSEVCLYRNGALVTRRGRAAPGLVEVPGLPLLLAYDSLRVRPARGQVRELEEGAGLETGEQADEEARGELAQVALEAEAATDRLRTVRSLLQLLQTLKPGERPYEGAPRVPDVSGWLKLRAFADSRVEALVAEHEDLVEQVKELKRRHSSLKRASRGEAEPPRVTRTLRFTLEAEGDAPVELALEYFVSAARWTPSYRLFVEDGRAALQMNAVCAQASGEDWNEAKLAFSTSDLDRSCALPELGSWRIGRSQPPVKPAFRPLPDDLDSLFSGFDDAEQRAGPPPAPAHPSPPPTPGGEGAAAAELTDEEEDEAEAFAADLSTAGRQAMYASFEDEATGEYALSEMLPLDAEADTTGGFSRRELMADDDDELEEASEIDVRAPAMMTDASEAMELGGGPPPPAARAAALAPPAPPLPPPPRPRLRYAYYRLEGPRSRRRGELVAVDPLEHLASLLDDHQQGDLDALRRAVAGLKLAAERLSALPRPAGRGAREDRSYPHVFEAASRHRVPSDGEWHTVFVQREEAPARLELRCVPRASEEVLRTLLFSSPEAAPHPPGPLLVYTDGAFRAETVLEPGEGKAGLELSLGIEPRVRVRSRVPTVSQAEKGLVSQTSRIEHEVLTVLESSLDEEAEVVVHDRVPVPAPGQRDLEVTVLSAGPGFDRTDRGPDGRRLPGGVQIRTRVPPRGRAEVKLAYRLVVPAKTEVVGGNRRE